jgi:gamma-glutamylcyclotransferase (GGCT)/AIG2-like uncharacterized protein YtfP
VNLFVYGTLRSDLRLPEVGPAAAARRVLVTLGRLEGRGWAKGALYAFSSFPALVETDEPGAEVRGEVWRLGRPAELFARLDRYEGRGYRRALRRIRMDSGRLLAAHVYLYLFNLGNASRIPSGDYADWLAGASPDNGLDP